MTEFHEVEIAGCHRRLPVCPVAGGQVRIAFLDVLGDLELIDAAMRSIAEAAGPDTFDVVLGGDTVGLVMAHHLSLVTGRPYVCARKKRTPPMRGPLAAQAQSVAAATPSTFYLDQVHAARLAEARVLVIDEVCSTGSTLAALSAIAREAGAAQVRCAVIATEGSPRDDVLSLAHLPVWNS